MVKRATREYHCGRCDRGFARLEHLQRHERSHTKEKPFGCDQCEKSFTRKDLLTRHLRLAHSASPAPQTPEPNPTASTQQVFDGLNVLASAVADHPFPSTRAERQHLLPATHEPFPAAPAVEETPFSEPFVYEGDDFTSFLDSIPLPSHPYSPTYQPLPLFPPLQFDSGSEYPSTLGHDGVATPRSSVLPRHGTQLPSLHLEESQPPHRARPPKVPVAVTTQCRDRIVSELRDYANVVPDQSIPSRHALSRCLTGYLNGYHDHYPFLHIPTLNIETCPLHIILSMASLGAQYCREHQTSISLFQVAKSITLEHIRRDLQWTENSAIQPKAVSTKDQSQDILETVQSLLMLTSVSSWFEHYPPHYEALYLRSLMETLLRKHGLNELPRQDGSWESWIRNESAKRLKLIVFCFFGIHTIVFDLPSMILTEEITLDLPCTEKEWTAATASEWMEVRQHGRGSPRLQDALNSLFIRTPSAAGQLESFTSLGGYVLIHATIQNIWLIQKACRLPVTSGSSLSPAQITSLEQALENWCQCWERNQESSIDPFNPNGPISFTSTALLRLAYIRLNADFSSARRLQTWNPDEIARSLRQNLSVQRSDRLTRAALHCAHALSTPIKLGINYVARTLVVSWSNQYALCSLECAVLLAKWLEIATVANPQPRLTEQESKLLEFVIEMVMEAQHGVSRSWLLANNTRLSAVVTRLWARLFTADYIYELVNLIGRSLNRYADLLESVDIP
ncbi:transcription factor domain-containing protein [Aspergillus undulatus]|uniref:transcription factor domain-containing protein n=1 Tax=Aspergillus undulatus TaxID=1810928 RepID=UPI003CCCAE10